ncbi:MAG: lamin tail domain-containing protein, partial [Candidatus Promineofilum sp.]|nr:lamin tail domain-containing protein [Promineifilum sp.]
IYAANTDWPHGNIRFWRAYAPISRWRWMLFDMDYAFSLNTGPGHNTLRQAMSTKAIYAYHSLILRKLWTNTEFRALFVQRFAAHLNTTFTTARVTDHINALSGAISPVMPMQIQRWKAPKTLAAWQTELTKLRTFANKRPDYVRSHLKTQLGGLGTNTLTIQVEGQGQVAVAGLPVAGGYSGLHFLSLPITLEALPAEGEDFSHWLETGSTNPIITVTLTGAMTRTAVFGEEPPPPPLPNIVINEIHYRPNPESDEPNKEFLELYHAGTATADLSGYTISAISFTFPAGALVEPGEYVVVAANSADPAYAALDADDVFDWVWGSPDNQKLSNSSEAVTLRHSDGRVVDTLTYDDDAPWPKPADGSGPSLSLLDEALDNTDPANWAASRQKGGSPGAENFPPLPPTPPLVINEVHYNPADAQGADADYEFIEIVNTGAEAVNLEGFTLVGVEFTFPAVAIEPGEYILIAANAANYTGSADVYQWTSGELDNAGERVALLDAFAQVADEVTYDDEAPWPVAPNGSGPSLSLGRPALDNSLPAAWGASREQGGTPGAANFPPLPLVINELHHTPAAAQGSDGDYEFLELHNAGATAIDLTGYNFLGVDAVLPAASIAPGEYVVVADNPATYSNNGYQVFNFDGGLSSSGERVTVSDPFGNVVDDVTYGVAAPWPSAPNAGGPSLSLLEPALDNTVAANWAASRQQGGSPGAENFPPLPPTPPLVINEIHTNPADAQGSDGDYEFIEIVNTGPNAVNLEGFTLEGVAFTFPTGATIEPNEFIVLAANSANYSGSYDVYQWTSGELDNAGERVALLDPFAQVADEVTYDDEAPWPVAPNGSGPTLSLGAPGLDNSLPANWAASDFVGGTPGAANWPALPLVVTEVHYKVNETLQPGGDDLWEFFELTNAGDRAFNLSGYTTTGVTAAFANGATIAAGETIVVANNAASYATAGCAVTEWSSGGLSSSGEALTFKNRFGVTVLSFTYGTAAPWPTAPNGGGPTLALLDEALANSDPANWDASRETGGTPCAENFPPLPPVPSLVINEIHYNPADAQGADADFEFIELVNTGPDAVNLEGVALEGVAFTFPAGATIAAGEHIVIAANAASYVGAYQAFQWASGELDDLGETLALRDAFGQLVDTVTYDDEAPWPTDPAGLGPSLSLSDAASDNSDPANWAASATSGGTPGAAN